MMLKQYLKIIKNKIYELEISFALSKLICASLISLFENSSSGASCIYEYPIGVKSSFLKLLFLIKSIDSCTFSLNSSLKLLYGDVSLLNTSSYC